MYFLSLKPNYHNEMEYDSEKLIIDTTSTKALPHKFRTSCCLTGNKKLKGLNLVGLKNLNISGSGQFSESNLPLVKKTLECCKSIIVVDLRQESHGFINGKPVSWSNKKNNANLGLTLPQVSDIEDEQLQAISFCRTLSFCNHPSIKISPKCVEDENLLVQTHRMSYIRIPVTDGAIPTEDTVSFFINFVSCVPADIHLYFHCKAGVGRTTVFMIMYDMIKNAGLVSFDAIINRQMALANFNAKEAKHFMNQERVDFLRDFYNIIVA